MKRVYDWAAVQAFHDRGNGFTACRQRFGFTHTAWIKAIRRGAIIARFRSTKPRGSLSDRRRIYDWAEVQRYYDEGHSYSECRQRFGFAAPPRYANQ